MSTNFYREYKTMFKYKDYDKCQLGISSNIDLHIDNKISYILKHISIIEAQMLNLYTDSIKYQIHKEHMYYDMYYR